MNGTATGSYTTYGTGYFSNVVLPDLQSHTQYYYQVTGSGRVPSFITARSPGDTSAFTYLMVGDMGLDNSANTMTAMSKNLPYVDFVHHVGDLSYADDWYLRLDTYEGAWNKWQTLMDPITSARGYMVLPGNHEATCTEATPDICEQSTRNFTAYRNRFRMPWQETGGVENMWFSYNYGNMHFTNIDTETDFPHAPEGPGSRIDAGPFGDQLAWLEADLAQANANRAAVPWLIVSGHRPLYSSGGDCSACKDAFEALFNKYNVDIYFCGHVHWYERLWPIAPGGKVTQHDYNNPSVPIYIVNGAAGNVEGHSHGDKQPISAFINDKDYGYGRVSVFNGTTLQWQFFAAKDNSLVDEVFIFKAH